MKLNSGMLEYRNIRLRQGYGGQVGRKQLREGRAPGRRSLGGSARPRHADPPTPRLRRPGARPSRRYLLPLFLYSNIPLFNFTSLPSF